MTERRVDLWWFRMAADTSTAAAQEERAVEVLGEAERRRHRKIENDQVARFFAFRRAARRAILASYCDTAARELVISDDPASRPVLLHPKIGIEFSASHSGTAGIVAVARAIPVGADLEILRPIDETRFSERILSAAERVAMQSVAPERRAELVIRAWTAKEAVIKAAGLSLDLALFRRISVPVAEAGQAWFPVDAAGSRSSQGIWQVCTVSLARELGAPALASVVCPEPASLAIIDAHPVLERAGLG